MKYIKAHADKVEDLRHIGKVKMKHLDEFLRFELDPREEIMEEVDYLNFYIPVNFDVDKVFGLEVCSGDNDDYIALYLTWHPEFQEEPENRFDLTISYCNNSTKENDIDLDVMLSRHQKTMISRRLNKEFKEKYGKTLRKYWKRKIGHEE